MIEELFLPGMEPIKPNNVSMRKEEKTEEPIKQIDEPKVPEESVGGPVDGCRLCDDYTGGCPKHRRNN